MKNDIKAHKHKENTIINTFYGSYFRCSCGAKRRLTAKGA